MPPETDCRVDLRGRAAIVTGGGAGCGRSIALALAAAGAAVVVNDLNPDRAEAVRAGIAAGGGRALACPGDVSNRFQAANLIERARDQFGRISLLVNAASAGPLERPLLRLDEWDWRRLLDVNLTGAFFCTQLLGRVMAEEGGGVILNVVFSTIPRPIPRPIRPVSTIVEPIPGTVRPDNSGMRRRRRRGDGRCCHGRCAGRAARPDAAERARTGAAGHSRQRALCRHRGRPGGGGRGCVVSVLGGGRHAQRPKLAGRRRGVTQATLKEISKGRCNTSPVGVISTRRR